MVIWLCVDKQSENKILMQKLRIGVVQCLH